MYTQEDLRGMSIEELINLINQITDERDMYQANIEYKKKNN